MNMDVPEIIETAGKRKFTVGKKLYGGDLADFYSSTYANGSGNVPVVIKIARDPRDNDLLENEVSVLRYLYPSTARDEKFYRYLPRLIDTAHLRDRRHVSIFPEMVGYVTLADVMAAYPKGIDFRDMVWMFKRLLSGLGFIGQMGVVHGAILPSHVLVHPEGHGAKILDWSYALNFSALRKAATPPAPDPPPPVAAPDPAPAPAPAAAPPAPATPPSVWELLRHNPFVDPIPSIADPSDPGPLPDLTKMHVKALSVDYEAFYAPEIFRKEPPTPATDLFMAAKCVIALLGGNLETNQLPEVISTSAELNDKSRGPLQAFLQVCLLPAQAKRPIDPWRVEEDLDNLLKRLVGPRKYRPFAMPPKGTPS